MQQYCVLYMGYTSCNRIPIQYATCTCVVHANGRCKFTYTCNNFALTSLKIATKRSACIIVG